MIEVKNLIRHFKSGDRIIKAVDDVSFTVPTGQFVAIVGRSGSGKSTLMYQMSALDRPNSGSVVIDGINVVELSDDERTRTRLNDMGYIFQDYANIPSLTALENVMVPLLMSGMDRALATEKASDALGRVGLGERLHFEPAKLSGGEQQRVSIARAIGHDPKIIFADEPTANLDLETGNHVMEVFSALHKEGQTIVMVTHEDEVAALTDRVIELSNGAIINDQLKNGAVHTETPLA